MKQIETMGYCDDFVISLLTEPPAEEEQLSESSFISRVDLASGALEDNQPG